VCDETNNICTVVPKSASTVCDDGMYCTSLTGDPGTPDHCDGAGSCTGLPVKCGPGDQCNDDVCDEDLDMCIVVPKSASTECDDGMYCTSLTGIPETPDHCDGFGSCVGIPVECSIEGCNLATCNEDDDICQCIDSSDPGDNLSIVKIFDDSPVPFNTSQSFTIIVTNTGVVNLTDVSISDDVAIPVEVTSVTPTMGSCDSPGQLIMCMVPELLVGESVIVTVDYIAGGTTVTAGGTDGYDVLIIYTNGDKLFGSTSTDPPSGIYEFANGTEVVLATEDTDTGDNTIFFPLLGYALHISCSDSFVNDIGPGFGEKGGPEEGDTPIALYDIVKSKDGVLVKECGCLLNDLDVSNKANATFDQGTVESDVVNVTILADPTFCEPCKASKKSTCPPTDPSEPPPDPSEEPGLDITKTFSSDTITENSTGTFEITVTNIGTTELTDVRVRDDLEPPSAISLTGVTENLSGGAVRTSGDCFDPPNINCLFDLPVGSLVTLTADFDVAASITDVLPFDGSGDDREDLFFRFASGETIEGSNDPVTADYSGTGTNIATGVDGNDLILGDPAFFNIHTSCSDLFTDGFTTKNKDDSGPNGPTPDNPDWRVVKFIIAKIKDGTLDKACTANYATAGIEVGEGGEIEGEVIATANVDIQPAGTGSTKQIKQKKKRQRQLRRSSSWW